MQKTCEESWKTRNNDKIRLIYERFNFFLNTAATAYAFINYDEDDREPVESFE